jgi:hypothetical protein
MELDGAGKSIKIIQNFKPIIIQNFFLYFKSDAHGRGLAKRKCQYRGENAEGSHVCAWASTRVVHQPSEVFASKVIFSELTDALILLTR